MAKERVAIPAFMPGNLHAPISAHFGHCDVFAVVDVEDGKIVGDMSVTNVDHSEGGCLVPVNLLADQGVDALIVGGMGLRPLMGFQEAGIKVYFGNGSTVGHVVESYLRGELREMSERAVCGGGNHC